MLARVARKLKELPIVRQHAADFGVNNKRKSAFIRFKSNLNVDITPAVLARFKNSIDHYYMPQGGGSIFWKPTNPKEDQRRLSQQNQAQRGLLLPTIRMLKWWNDHLNQGRLKGIHLEVMIERALAGYYLEGLAQALHMAFASIARQLDSYCQDPTGLGAPLDVNLSQRDRNASKNHAAYAHLCSIRASNRFAEGDFVGGIAEWRQVFPHLSII